LLAFDEALAAGADPSAGAGAASSLRAVHECQRLLEAVWPRHIPESPDLPRQFGRFSIVRELGRGAFGVVFLAEDPALRRQVALKVPRAEVLALASVRRRFLREAEAASRLDHPNIVPVYEMGEEGPVLYIASAYCQGPTLAEWLRQRTTPMPWGEVARLARVLAEAVAHAHGRGILHRDLKPSNILLPRGEYTASANGGGGRGLDFVPRICDFGLAKLLDEVSHDTSTGLAIGSPPYMAPEQAAGLTREQGPATDVYALGVILYELLTGRPPLRGETDLETLRLVSDQDPPRPRALRPGLPRDLETICLKCLEKRSDRRYAGAAGLAEDLGRFLDGRPIRARRSSPGERLGKWAKRRPVHAALAGVFGIIAVTGFVGLEWARARERRHNEVLREALDRSRRSEEEARLQRDLVVQHQAANQLKLVGWLNERGEAGPAWTMLDALGESPRPPESRGFAWRYLDRLTRPRVKMLPALPERVTGLAYSRDGRTIALLDASQQTYLLDVDSGRLRELSGQHRFGFNANLIFSPDGRVLASLTRGRTKEHGPRSEVKLWYVATGEELSGLPEFYGVCYGIVFSPDGRSLVTVEGTGGNPTAPVRSWAISDDRRRVTLGESLRADQLAGHLAPTSRSKASSSRPFRLSDAIAAIPGAEPRTAVWTHARQMRLYRQVSGYCFAVCLVEEDAVVVLPRNDLPAPYTPAQVDAIRRDARALTGCDRDRIILHDVPVLWAELSPDGRTAAVFSPYRERPHEGRLLLINVATGEVVAGSPWGDLSPACLFRFSPEGDDLLVGGIGTQARRWDSRDLRGPNTLRGHQKEVWGLAFSPDGRTLVSAADDHTLKVWDVASGRERRTLKGHGSLVTAVAYSPGGALLASASFEALVRLWDAATGQAITVLEGHTERVRTVAFSPDGKWLASAGNDYQVRLWEVAERHTESSSLAGHTGQIYSLAYSSDGKTLFTGAQDKTIRLWDVASGEVRAVWQAETPVYCVAPSPDGRTLATAHPDGRVMLWDIGEGGAPRPLPGHTGEVYGVAFSPDGLTLISVGRDRTIRVWDPLTAQEILTLKGHDSAVRCAAFSPDGTILATGSDDGAIKLWRAPAPPK
jgi:WD40 repeat protein/tRNA A-37 threonylcarbamoyl transferase component Bud32